MDKLEIIEKAKKLTQKEYSWWEPKEPEELFAMEIINLIGDKNDKI